MVLADLVSPKASLLGLQMDAFLLCLHTAFPLCTLILAVSASSDKYTSLGSHPYNFI